MKLKFYLLSTLLALLVFGNTKLSAQSIIATESFDATTFAPTAWILNPASTQQGPWLRRTVGTFPTCSMHSGAGMARFSSRNYTSGTKQSLISRQVDYTNRGNQVANVSLWMYRDDFNAEADSITVWVTSIDSLDASAIKLGSITRNRQLAIPDTQASNGWYQYSFSVPLSFVGTTTRFIFEGTSETVTVGQGAHMYIDDVSFDEFPPVCSGIPNVGNISSTVSVICNSSGSAILSHTAPIVGMAGITIIWESAPAAVGPWTAMSGNGTSISTGTISNTTYYKSSVYCANSSMTYTTPIFTQLVSINPSPIITVSPTNGSICPGGNPITLVATGGALYSWSPNLGLNVDSGSVVLANPTSNTQYIVTGTDSNGCVASDTASIQMANVPIVSISSNIALPVCEGTEIILNSIQGGGPGANSNTYLWSDGKTTRRDTLVATTNMFISVTVTNQAGCSSTDSIEVTVTPGAIANFGATQNGSTIMFADSSVAASSWFWDFGDGNSSSVQNPTYTYSAYGSFVVTLIITSAGCNNDTITKVINNWPLSLGSTTANEAIQIYPNPVSNYIKIKTGINDFNHICIKNIAGQTLLEQSILKSNNEIELHTQSLSKGLYFIEITQQGRIFRKKFTKE